ncbi:MAG: class I SAM-dependent methyltransferase, partial [Candidatus Zixiibacteriota bacterium]
MTEDPFKKFAGQYDRMSKDDPRRREFFRALIGKYGIKTVLDCACGTGNDLVLWHESGVQIYGSDVSEAMLAEAKKKLASNRIDVPLRRIDFRELPANYDTRFDAVLCLTTSLPQLPDETE